MRYSRYSRQSPVGVPPAIHDAMKALDKTADCGVAEQRATARCSAAPTRDSGAMAIHLIGREVDSWDLAKQPDAHGREETADEVPVT